MAAFFLNAIDSGASEHLAYSVVIDKSIFLEKSMLKHLLLSLTLIFVSPLFAAEQSKAFVAGEHYQLITPAIRTADPDKIEVVEFFWYGCGHCYNFEPVIGQWKKTLGDDVDFKGSPAVWAPQMELHSKMYYTAEVLGVQDKMHLVLFQAMNVDKKRLYS
jgi:thiol:disulfide interchange protein DsbA